MGKSFPHKQYKRLAIAVGSKSGQTVRRLFNKEVRLTHACMPRYYMLVRSARFKAASCVYISSVCSESVCMHAMLCFLLAHVEMNAASTSDTSTQHFLVLLCVLIALLQSSYGAPKQNGSNNDSLPTNSTATLATTEASPPSVKGNTTASPATTLPAPLTRTDCQKKLVNITVGSPREGCSPGLMVAVPVCSGTCISYVHYLKDRPYKESQCSCCRATTYRFSKRTVTFQCGGTTETISYHIAAAIDCNCSPCNSHR